MNWKEFEVNLKNIAQNHPSDMDTEAFWNELAPKKKKRYPIWIFLIPILIASITASYIIININSSKIEHQDELKSKEEVHEKSDDNLITTKHEEQKNEISNPSLINISTTQKSKKLLPNQFIDSKVQQNNYSIQKNKNVNYTREIEAISQITKINEDSNFNHFSKIPENQSDIEMPTKEKVIISDIDYLKPSQLQIINWDKKQLYFEQSDYLKINIEKKQNSINFNFVLGIGAWNPNFKTNTIDISSRNTNVERSLESRNIGFLIQFNKGFLKHFETGLIYQENISKIYWNKKIVEEKTSTEQSLVSINTYINGKIDSIYGNKTTIRTLERTVNQYNKFSSLKLPIFYNPLKIKLNQKISLVPKIGILFDFYQQNTGKFISSQDQVVPFGESNYNAKGLGLSYSINCPILYKIDSKSSVSISPYFNQYLSNVISQNSDLQSRPIQLGVNLGYQIGLR